MTKIIIFSEKNDSHRSKIDWLISELKKRDIDILVPDIGEECEKTFQELRPELLPDTLVVAKGNCSVHILKELEKGRIGLKGLLIITDETNKFDILKFEFSKIQKKVLQFFVYAFSNNSTSQIEDTKKLAQGLDIDLSMLEGAEDNSDYEDILIDILSLQD